MILLKQIKEIKIRFNINSIIITLIKGKKNFIYAKQEKYFYISTHITKKSENNQN